MQTVDGINFYETKQGYLLGHIEGKPKRMHIYVWEKHNGKIPKGYQIHHIDGDKENNSIENLQLVTPKEHSKHHIITNPALIEKVKKNLDYAREFANIWHGSNAGNKWHKEHRKNSIGDKLERNVEKHCEICGKSFFVNSMCANKSKYCGNNCKAKALRRRRKAERDGEN